ncbi:NAD-dependent epimerase/dehydratase family protein (plasmid) [Haloferacaceae archaeon DSL9]
MDLTGKNVLLTGGAGFIGSHLAERLLTSGNDVVIADDCSNGNPEWIPDDGEFVHADLTDPEAVADVITPDLDLVFHLAARKSVTDADPREQFAANTSMTHTVLARMREVGVTDVAFTSSSTIYGEAPRPTPENYGPLEPISVYGASKLADEGLLSAYAHSHGFTVWTFRFANIVGPRLRGAVVSDFIEKLHDTPETLTILGDGRQEKSYMHIEDCLDAMCCVIERADGPLNTYNLGTRTTTAVSRIASIVSDEMGLDPEYEYTGGDRGWTGDVPKMRLSIEKLSELGWSPKMHSDAAVRRAASELRREIT